MIKYSNKYCKDICEVSFMDELRKSPSVNPITIKELTLQHMDSET